MTEPTPGDWTPCPPGELGRLSAWLRFRRRVRTATWLALGLVATAGVVGAARLAYPVFGASPSPASCPSGGCGCGTPAAPQADPCHESAPATKDQGR
jgi:hypothetical protein